MFIFGIVLAIMLGLIIVIALGDAIDKCTSALDVLFFSLIPILLYGLPLIYIVLILCGVK